MISVFQNSENSGYEYQVAPDMAMTVRMIMILLYGAGGVPGRGEIPMSPGSNGALDDFPLAQGLLRTNTALHYIAVYTGRLLKKMKGGP